MRSLILILAIAAVLMSWYVYQGIKTLTQNWQNKQLRLAVRRGYWFLFACLMGSFAYAFYLRMTNDYVTPFMQGGINAFMTYLVTALVFILVIFAEDIYRGFVAVVRYFKRDRATHVPLLPARRRFISQLAVALAGIPFVSFLYGVTKGKYDFTVHRHALYFDDLPEAFDGFTITQLSDIHAGSFTDPAAVQRGIDLVKAQKSDLFVFTGDLINDLAPEIVPYMGHFSQIQAPYGQFSVLGNHDYGMYHQWSSETAQAENLQQVKNHHKTLGYRLLLDEHVLLEKGGEKIALLGVENWGQGFIQKGDLDKALEGVDKSAFKILLSHDPSHWQEIVKHHPTQVHVTLAGHTHGMQVGVETPLFKWSPAQYRYKNWAGLAQENNKMLYVNRGFGFIGFAGRVGIWPEVTVLELRKKRA